ncbi:MAG: hypothetical protein ACP5R2_11525 [Anaerolineae bacterium]
MTSRQKLVLAMLSLLVVSELCVAAFLARSYLMTSQGGAVAQATPPKVSTPAPSPTWTMPPTWTPIPLPQETKPPTPTATRVVKDTPTPTITPTYTRVVLTTPDTTQQAIPNANPTRRVTKRRAPIVTPTPSYPFKLVATQEYTTTNSFFVIYAQIKSGDALVGGYRIVGTHQPSGLTFESPPSCWDLCKASGPRISTTPCCNEYCTPISSSLPPHIQEGNVAFEAPIYETGSYQIRLLDPQGQPASDLIEIPIDANDKKWFFLVFNQ